jgi:hypothetical protein
MWKSIRVIAGVILAGVLGNAAYAFVVGAVSMMGGWYTAHSASLSGVPPYIFIPLGVLVFLGVAIGASLIRSLLFHPKEETEQPEGEISVKTANDEADGQPTKSMNDLIREAARNLDEVPCGAGWLHAIAENDRTQIQNAVQVRGIGLRNLMDDGIPRLEFVFSVYNKSVLQISIDNSIDGYIRFNHQEKLRKNNLEMKENHAVDCPPRRSATFTLEQTLLDSEVRYITSQTDDRLFWFDQLVIMIKGGSFSPDVVPQRLKIDGYVSRKEQVWREYND